MFDPMGIVITFIIYVCIGIVNFARLEKEYGTEGPDGLIPLVGGILWPINLAYNTIMIPIKFLVWIGRML